MKFWRVAKITVMLVSMRKQAQGWLAVEQGRGSGESMWVEFVGSLLCSKRFPLGTPILLSPLKKQS